MKREFPIENLIRIDIDRKLGVAYAVYEEVNKIEVGKWYKSTECPIFCLKTNNTYDVGFYDGEWDNGIHCLIPNLWQPANMKEVEKLLVKEAEKRGFKDGIKYKGMTIAKMHVVKLPLHTNENHLFDDEGNVLFDFKSGQWAEIIEEEKDFYRVVRCSCKILKVTYGGLSESDTLSKVMTKRECYKYIYDNWDELNE